MADVKGNTVIMIFYDNDDIYIYIYIVHIYIIMYIVYDLYCPPDQYYLQVGAEFNI